jgi:hypothetical protein
MERNADADVFQEFGPGVVGCRGPFQMAAVLMHEGNVSEDGVMRVAGALLQRGLAPTELAERLRDLCRRALLTPDQAQALGRRMARDRLIAPMDDPGVPDAAWVAVFERGPERPWTPPRFVGEG